MFDKHKYEEDLQKLQEEINKLKESNKNQSAMLSFLANHNKDDIVINRTHLNIIHTQAEIHTQIVSVVYIRNGVLCETIPFTIPTDNRLALTILENTAETAILKFFTVPPCENSVSYYYLLNKKEKIVTAIPESIAVGKSAEKKTTAKTTVKKSTKKKGE